MQTYDKANLLSQFYLTQKHNDLLVLLANKAKRSKSSLFRAMLDYANEHREILKELENKEKTMNLINTVNEKNRRAAIDLGALTVADNSNPTGFVSKVSDFYNVVQCGQSAQGGYAVPSKSLDSTYLLDLIDKQSILEECSRNEYQPNKEYLMTLDSAKYDYESELNKAALKDSPTMISIKTVEARINTCIKISEDAKESMIYSPKEWCISNVSSTFADAITDGILHNSTWGLASLTPVEYDAENAEAYNKLRYVKTGSAAAISDSPFVELAKMIEAIQAPFLHQCKFYMSQKLLNKLLSSTNSEKYLVYDKGTYVLFGFPVVCCSHISNEAANNYVAYFGTLKSVMYSVDGNGVYTVEDVATDYPNSLLYMAMIFQVAIDGRKLVALKCAA